MWHMFKRIATLLAAAAVFTFPGAAGATGGDTNQVSYWCPTGGVKLEPVSTPFIVPAPPAGTTWTLLVLKAATTNTTVADPVVGAAYTSGVFNGNGVEQAISHVILCSRQTATTTSTSTTSSTTTSTTSTTIDSTIPAPTEPPSRPTTTTTEPCSTGSSEGGICQPIGGCCGEPPGDTLVDPVETTTTAVAVDIGTTTTTTAAPITALPRTGAPSGSLVVIAGLFVLAGGVALIARRTS